MMVDIAEIFKYGWMLLVALIPKAISIGNSKLKALEKRDNELSDSLTGVSEKIAIIDVKMDAQDDVMRDIKNQLEKTNELLTKVRISVGDDR